MEQSKETLGAYLVRSRYSTRRGLRLLASSAVILAGLVPSVHAQAVSPASAASDKNSDIVVTAQRNKERLQDVPAPVTVLTTAALSQRGDAKLEDYFRSVPGLTLQANGRGFNELVIRGIVTGAGTTPTVGIYVDDTPLGSATAQARGDTLAPDFDPADLQQIEVLKGPQGTLYGASALGGLLKYTTVQPDPSRVFGHLSVDGLTVDHGDAGYAVRGGVNIPLSPDAAFYVSGFSKQDPGYVDDPVTGKTNVNTVKSFGGRAAILWRPGEGTTVKLSALYQSRHALGSQRADYQKATLAPIYGDLQQIRLPGTETDRERMQVYNATVAHDFAAITASLSTSYSISDYRSREDLTQLFSALFAPDYGLDALGVPLIQHFRTRRFTEELRLNGKITDRLSWQGGAYYTHEKSLFYQLDDTADPVTGDHLDLPLLYQSQSVSTYSEIAGFADLTYRFTPKFELQGGVRYGSNRQHLLETDAGLENVTGQERQNSRDHSTTFLVTAKYSVTPNSIIYARVASGYRVGGPNIGVIEGPKEFGADRTINYEIGTKYNLFDNMLYIDASLFDIEWRKIQLTAFNDFSETYYVNGGKAVSRGVEISGVLKPARGLSLSGNFTYTDAHLTDDAPNGIYAPSGSRLPYSAHYAFQLGADYEAPISRDWQAFGGVRYSHAGERLSDFESNASRPRFVLPAYDVVDLNAGIENQTYKLNIYLKNVGDRRGLIGSSALNLSHSGPYSATMIQPRTIGGSISMKF